MEKQFNVAFLGMRPGDPNSDNYDDMVSQIGIRTYSMNAEKIIDIVQNVQKGELSDIQYGLTPEKQCNVMYGGRFFPFFSRDEVVNVISNVDVIIVSACVEYYYARAFLMWLTPETLPESCTVVLRLPFSQDELPYVRVKASEWLAEMGMNDKGEYIGKKGKKKATKKKGKIQTSRQVFVIGLEEYGGIIPEEGIPLLRSSLLREGVINEALKPVKETVSAGKSLFNWSQSLAGWMSRLVRSN